MDNPTELETNTTQIVPMERTVSSDPVRFYMLSRKLRLPSVLANIDPVRFIEYSVVLTSISNALGGSNDLVSELEIGTGRSAFSFGPAGLHPNLEVRMTDLPLSSEGADFVALARQSTTRLEQDGCVRSTCAAEIQNAREALPLLLARLLTKLVGSGRVADQEGRGVYAVMVK
jgi:hypothetical protein